MTTTSDKKEVLKNIAAITRKFINSISSDDISELSDELYGMMNHATATFSPYRRS
jgi:hypothetical protein